MFTLLTELKYSSGPQRYAVWNNKGGVGKSTLTFHLATLTATKQPKMKVLVIDMCPQANVSIMLLQTRKEGERGDATVDKLCLMDHPKTVVGYLTAALSRNTQNPDPKPEDYMLKVQDYNSEVPSNVFLVCGDPNLEIIAPALTSTASST